jgi:hypothetical protein
VLSEAEFLRKLRSHYGGIVRMEKADELRALGIACNLAVLLHAHIEKLYPSGFVAEVSVLIDGGTEWFDVLPEEITLVGGADDADGIVS